MRKLFEAVKDRLRSFVQQRDNFALVVRTPSAQAMAILQLMEMIDEESSSEMYWFFVEPFTNPADYVAAVVDSFASKQELVRLLQEKEGMKPWPAIPAPIKDKSLPPARLMRELMVFARSLLPFPDGALMVWVLFPAEVADPAAYAGLMREVLAHEFPFPWCHHMRVLLRDEPARPALTPGLEGQPRVEFYEPDLSHEAINRAVEEQINDESLDLEERMQALMMSAATDYSHKRYPQAQEKYRLLYEHHAAVGNQLLAALALNGLGEVHRATGDREKAAAAFEEGLVRATDEQHLPNPLVLNLSLQLGSLRMEEKRWAEAEGYYDCVQQLATMQRNPEIKLLALEQMGIAQYEQKKVEQAVETWTAGVIVAEKLEQPKARDSMMQRLRDHYTRTGNRVKLQELEKDLEKTRAEIQQAVEA